MYLIFLMFVGVHLKKLLSLSFNAIQQIGELEDTKAFLLDVTWPETYPEMAPKLSLDAFFNNRM